MMDSLIRKSFRLSALFVAITFATSALYAFEDLEKLEDEELAESTGEGVAILPQDFSVRFNDANETATGANGAGYIRLIPVGPLSTTQESKGYKKADIYLYGLSLGQSKQNIGAARTSNDWGVGFGNLGTGADDFGRTIGSWGSADNPWILKTLTKEVPDFAGVNGSISHFNIEAPLRHVTIPTTGAEASAYNLKMGLWLDGFMRDKNVAETVGSYNGLSNRFRLGAVWDGFSLHGTNMKIFQTLGGATNTGGLSTSYNNTLGLAALIRLNSFDTKVNLNSNGSFVSGFGATVTRGTPAYITPDNPASIPASTNLTANNMVLTYSPLIVDRFNESICGTATERTANAGDGLNSGHCLTREAIATRTFSASGSNSWVPPSIPGALRLSTKATENSATGTPAIGGLGEVPNFDRNEGVYLYGLNVNVVLGNLFQPLIFNTPDGNNFSVEITRIPNKEEVYSLLYQPYGSTLKTPTKNLSYLGNTCNFYKCGDAVTLNGVSYQGSNATHSSITIGSTLYNASNNTVSAYKGIEALGISFGPIESAPTQTLQSTASQSYQQVYQATRTGGCTNSNWLGQCQGYGFNAWGNWTAQAKTKYNQGDYNQFMLNNPPTVGQVLGVTSNVPTSNPLTVPGKSVSNNFGSAAIDGLLIQHFKLTTTGLN